MAGSLFSTANLARIAKVLALLCFFLPWVTISCAEQTLVSMSGYQLATGQVTMTNPMTNQVESPPGVNGGDMLVIVGAVLILAALAATFILKGRNGFIAAIAGAALAGGALCYTVLVKIPADALTSTTGPASGGAGGAGSMGPTPEQLAQMIQVKTEMGFWLTILALAAAIVLNFLAMRGSAPIAAAAPAAAPPPE
jgi:hypothetical protein